MTFSRNLIVAILLLQKKLLLDDNIYLKLKKKTLNKDLNTYFSSVVKNLCDSILDNEDNKSKALVILNEIKSYNILNSSLNKVIISLDDNYTPENDSDYKAILDLGLDNCNNGNFAIAINLLKKYLILQNIIAMQLNT